MKIFWRSLGLIVIASLLAQPVWAQRNKKAAVAFAAQRGEMLSQSCFACHGPRGGSVASAVPSVGGQGAVYLVTALMRFKEDQRPSSVMGRIAKGYTDPEIMEIAEYLAKQPFQRDQQKVDVNKVELGAAAYRKVCSECHLNDGRESAEADYPVLAGQRLLYMQMQMHEINNTGGRRVDAKFAAMLDKLNKDEVEAVLHFFASQL